MSCLADSRISSHAELDLSKLALTQGVKQRIRAEAHAWPSMPVMMLRMIRFGWTGDLRGVIGAGGARRGAVAMAAFGR